MLINIKTRHFHSSINHQENLSQIAHITSYFRPVNIAKFLRTAFLQSTSRSSRLQMFFKTDVLSSFTKFTGKHLCWIFFLKNLQAGGLQPHKKEHNTVVFLRVCKVFKSTFSYRTPLVNALHLWSLLLCFFKKVLLNSYFPTLLWRTNIFSFSAHRLMYTKSKLFVYFSSFVRFSK